MATPTTTKTTTTTAGIAAFRQYQAALTTYHQLVVEVAHEWDTLVNHQCQASSLADYQAFYASVPTADVVKALVSLHADVMSWGDDTLAATMADTLSALTSQCPVPPSVAANTQPWVTAVRRPNTPPVVNAPTGVPSGKVGGQHQKLVPPQVQVVASAASKAGSAASAAHDNTVPTPTSGQLDNVLPPNTDPTSLFGQHNVLAYAIRRLREVQACVRACAGAATGHDMVRVAQVGDKLAVYWETVLTNMAKDLAASAVKGKTPDVWVPVRPGGKVMTTVTCPPAPQGTGPVPTPPPMTTMVVDGVVLRTPVAPGKVVVATAVPPMPGKTPTSTEDAGPWEVWADGYGDPSRPQVFGDRAFALSMAKKWTAASGVTWTVTSKGSPPPVAVPTPVPVQEPEGLDVVEVQPEPEGLEAQVKALLARYGVGQAGSPPAAKAAPLAVNNVPAGRSASKPADGIPFATCAILRALHQLGWTKAQATHALSVIGRQFSPTTVDCQMQSTLHRGNPAPLTADHVAKLLATFN